MPWAAKILSLQEAEKIGLIGREKLCRLRMSFLTLQTQTYPREIAAIVAQGAKRLGVSSDVLERFFSHFPEHNIAEKALLAFLPDQRTKNKECRLESAVDQLFEEIADAAARDSAVFEALADLGESVQEVLRAQIQSTRRKQHAPHGFVLFTHSQSSQSPSPLTHAASMPELGRRA